MSIAAPAAVQQYRSTAEDKLLAHMSKVAAKAHAKGELEQSTELYEHLVAARRQRHGDSHPLTLHAISAFSDVAKDRGDYVLAEGLIREATAASEETLGAMHPDSLRNLSQLATVLAHQSKLEEAERAARDAVERSRVVFGEAHANTSIAENCLQDVLRVR